MPFLVPDNPFVLAGGAALALVLAYWYIDERSQTSSAGDTVERVGRRAERATGGLFGALGSLIIVLISIGLTIGDNLLDFAVGLVSLAGMDPMVVTSMLTAVIGALGLSGLLDLSPGVYLLVALFVIIGGIIWRRS